jgi:hypothetical protein
LERSPVGRYRFWTSLAWADVPAPQGQIAVSQNRRFGSLLCALTATRLGQCQCRTLALGAACHVVIGCRDCYKVVVIVTVIIYLALYRSRPSSDLVDSPIGLPLGVHLRRCNDLGLALCGPLAACSDCVGPGSCLTLFILGSTRECLSQVGIEGQLIYSQAQGGHVAGLFSLSSRLLEPQQTSQMLDPFKSVAAIDKVGIVQRRCSFASRHDPHDIILSSISWEPTDRAGLPCCAGVQRQCNRRVYQAPSQKLRDSGGRVASCSTNGIWSPTP